MVEGIGLAPTPLPLALALAAAAAAAAAATAAATAAAEAEGTAVEGAAWPASAARHGFCGVTNDGVEGDCARQGSKGSWANGVHRIRGMDDCVGRCVACDGCRYVTYSAENEDCSWYWSCDVGRLSRDPAFRTLQVRRADADVGGVARSVICWPHAAVLARFLAATLHAAPDVPPPRDNLAAGKGGGAARISPTPAGQAPAG